MGIDIALLVLRVAIGAVVAMHGFLKLGWVGKGGSPTGTAGWFENALGFKPGPLWAWTSIVAEGLGGTLMVLGLGGPLTAALVAADLIVVTWVAHVPKGFWAQNGGWEFPVPLAAGAFALAFLGYGRWSLDSVLGLSYSEQLVTAWWVLMAIGVVAVLISRAIFAPKAAPRAT